MQAALMNYSASDVLRAFYRDAPFLFLGSAFITVALVAAAFSAVRRRLDPLLIYFALFAGLYGLRLWLRASLVRVSLRDLVLYQRLVPGISYLILVPAFLFFASLGLRTRSDRLLNYTMAGIGGALALVTFAFGNHGIYEQINNVVIVLALLFVIGRIIFARVYRADPDFAVIRWGLLVFIVFALVVNVADFFSIHLQNLEPFGFVAFLASLGYVAARRTLHRDQQLNEIQNELEVARRIQLSILPAEFPKSAHFKIASRYLPMTSVAGDFYDYVVAGDHQAGLLIADVSGHGVPAALIASMVKLAASSQRNTADDPARFLTGMNAALCGNTQNQFVTAAYVHLNAKSGELRYSAAGHPPMLLLRNGAITKVEENGLMLAAFDFASYTNAVHKLESGDRLLLYTDGIIEAANASGDFFGQDALCELLKNTAKLPSSSAADSIVASVRGWSARQDDDLTVLVCDYVKA
ncbi:MAG TPA: PP2C family protein-serine/threonine phosphatase [Terriglobales bacterium]|nr:PP2C family protein-serine/threonine phosphatase [Terriglobales bacterium]